MIRATIRSAGFATWPTAIATMADAATSQTTAARQPVMRICVRAVVTPVKACPGPQAPRSRAGCRRRGRPGGGTGSSHRMMGGWRSANVTGSRANAVPLRIMGSTSVPADPERGLEVRVLGPVDIRVDGEPLVVDTRKAIAILALLAVEGRPYARDELAAMLWPESDDESARERAPAHAVGPALRARRALGRRRPVGRGARRRPGPRRPVGARGRRRIGRPRAACAGRRRSRAVRSWPGSRSATARTSTIGGRRARSPSSDWLVTCSSGWRRPPRPRETCPARSRLPRAGSTSIRWMNPLGVS